MTARRLLPYQWCWRCGRAVPNGFVCRRVVQTGSSHSTSYGTTLHVSNTAYYHPVSLCPRCDEEITEEERARRSCARLKRFPPRATVPHPNWCGECRASSKLAGVES